MEDKIEDINNPKRRRTDFTEAVEMPQLVITNNGLEVEHIGKRYGGRPVVRDVSLRLSRGEADEGMP